MENKIVTVNAPKTKKAALNQAIYFLNQIDLHNKRRENIMTNKTNVEKKLQGLEETLNSLNLQLSKVETTSDNWRGELKKLQDSYNLTQAEILEAKSEALRIKISDLRHQAEITETGQTERF